MNASIQPCRARFSLVAILIFGFACSAADVTTLSAIPCLGSWCAPPASTTSASGLPCDVQDLFADECQHCHGTKPAGGAPMSLVSYDDLTAPSITDPSVSNAERALVRMKDTASPMPIGALLESNKVAVLEDWLANGTPPGDCQPIVPDAGAGGSGPIDPDTPPEGLPCEVQDVLVNACHACHGSVPAGGAPMSLLSYDNLMAPSKVDPSVSNLERALIRMKDAASPMPPDGLLDAGDVAAVETWLAAGAPFGDCEPIGPGPFDVDPVCSSDKYWSGDESPTMHPGGACITCHEKNGGDEPGDEGAPALYVGGTVFPTAHEPDDCYGFAGATVEITDANNNVFTLNTNSTGNFLRKMGGKKLIMPISARVLYNGKERKMQQKVDTGDCNSCHTQDGANGAPGRIILP